MTTLLPAVVTPGEVVKEVAAYAGAAVTIGAVVWWFIWPRIEDKLQAIAKGVDRVEEHAATAASETAGAAGDLAEIKRQVQDIASWRTNFDRRLGHVEGALIALLGPELRRRLNADLADPPPPEETP